MAALHMLCSLKLRSCNQVSKASKNLFLVSATNTMTPTSNITYQTTNLHQNTMFQVQEFSLSRPRKLLVADQGLVKEHENKVKTKTEAEVAEEEIGRIIQRLEKAVERVRELEIEKFMGKVKGVVSYEDSLLVEEISREIVSKFLEKPIQYLRSSDGNLEEKIKELRLLACVLEESNTS